MECKKFGNKYVGGARKEELSPFPVSYDLVGINFRSVEPQPGVDRQANEQGYVDVSQACKRRRHLAESKCSEIFFRNEIENGRVVKGKRSWVPIPL